MDELRDFVRSTGSEKNCQICWYTSDKLDNLVKHYALGHSKLDELLQDEELMNRKKEVEAKKPKRLSFGPNCPICGQKGRDRDHIARHFINELMEIVQMLPKKSKCNMCDYRNSRNDYMAKHIGLYHCKLDEFMQNTELVEQKKALAAKVPKKVSMGDFCIICNNSMPSREHVARHFQQELLDLIGKKSPSLQSCPECEFSAEKPEYVARHLGLVHCKLDELLSDQDVVAKKIAEFGGEVGAAGGNKAAEVKSPMVPVRKSQRQKEAEERHAAEQRQLEIKRRREEDMKRMQMEAKAAAAAAAAAAAPPKKKARVEPYRNSSGGGGGGASTGMSLLEGQLRKGKITLSKTKAMPPKASVAPKMVPQPQQGTSLLMNTLLRGKQKSPVKATWPLKQTPQARPGNSGDEIVIGGHAPETAPAPMSALFGQGSNSRSPLPSTSITIKRATKAKWQIKPKTAPTLEEKRSRIQQEIEEEEEQDDDYDMMMVPEVSHSLGGDEDEDNGGMLLEPEIIMDTSANNVAAPSSPSSAFAEEEEFCDLCGMDLTAHADSAPCLPTAESPQPFDKCAICEIKQPSREHVTRHFVNELVEVVQVFPDPERCPQCDYNSPDNSKVAIHIALAHAQLEIYLDDTTLVNTKRQEAEAVRREWNERNKAFAGTVCPICDQTLNKSHSRDHIVWHFMEQRKSL